MKNVMKNTPRWVWISFFFLFAVTVTVLTLAPVIADLPPKTGYVENINPDGTGWCNSWHYNDERTAYFTQGISKWTPRWRTKMQVSAGCSALPLDSNGGLHRGDYRVVVGGEGFKGRYRVGVSRGTYKNYTFWFKSPREAKLAENKRASGWINSDTDSNVSPDILDFP